MTMVTNTREIPAGQFKAKCLALLDEVAQRGETLVITKRGKAVAKVVPVKPPKRRSLRGSVLYEGDLISPIDATWDATS
ncbi:MAG: type II toxin-antitoxin system Phd/YefM family antitoxin [Planctomycetes bacterium]|nr:type II toxin-antitoxin system Phd/YefM family antitoxin [Planctomycetota bacterium]